jgi:hypothetical protein
VDQPLAIKEQESVAPSFLASGMIFAGILCPTVYRCPNCRSVYRMVLGPGDVFLGEGHRTCSKCQQAFRDRSKEWSEISSIDRFLFLFPMVVGGWMIVAFVACVLFSYIGWTLGTTSVLALVAIFFVMLLIAWFVFRGYQIFCSVCRFSLRGKTKAT